MKKNPINKEQEIKNKTPEANKPSETSKSSDVQSKVAETKNNAAEAQSKIAAEVKNRNTAEAQSKAAETKNKNRGYENRKNQEVKIFTLQEIKNLNFSDLNLYARKLGIIGASFMPRPDLIEKIEKIKNNLDQEVIAEGVLERLPEGFGFLRSARFDYISSVDDVYVSPSQIRRFGLKTGDAISGSIRKPKDGEKYFALLKVNKINFEEPVKTMDRVFFWSP